MCHDEKSSDFAFLTVPSKTSSKTFSYFLSESVSDALSEIEKDEDIGHALKGM